MIRVLIVDDHPALRAGLRSMLAVADDLRGRRQRRAAVARACELAASCAPDVILMDLEMPDLDGAAATREIVAERRAGAAVVVLTSFGDRPRILEALDAGATGYLLKDAEPEESSVRSGRRRTATRRWTRARRARCSPPSARRHRTSPTASARSSPSSRAGHANKVIALRLGISPQDRPQHAVGGVPQDRRDRPHPGRALGAAHRSRLAR